MYTYLTANTSAAPANESYPITQCCENRSEMKNRLNNQSSSTFGAIAAAALLLLLRGSWSGYPQLLPELLASLELSRRSSARALGVPSCLFCGSLAPVQLASSASSMEQHSSARKVLSADCRLRAYCLCLMALMWRLSKSCARFATSK